jgi:hypothetical protein
MYDENKHFYRAIQAANGSWQVTHNASLYPIKHNPRNLLDCPVEFATNRRYFSMNRSINYPLQFIHDGAAILNHIYLNGKGVNQNFYFAIFEFDSVDGIYKLTYNGKFDFQQKSRNEKIATFTVPVIDDSAWGVLSQNDDVVYSIDCSENNPKSVKVLFDNFSLRNRYTYQTVGVDVPINMRLSMGNGTAALPFVLVNQDGDSYGIISKNQTLEYSSNYNQYIIDSSNYHLYTYYPITGVKIQGKFTVRITVDRVGAVQQRLKIFFATSTGQERVLFDFPAGSVIFGQPYSIDLDFTIDLAAGEKMFFFGQVFQGLINNDDRMILDIDIDNIFITAVTKAESAICYGLRPLDLLKDIVGRATLERYTIDSEFFTINNKTVLIPGDSFRGVKYAKIYTSFRDFFETFSALFFMALRVSNGSLFMELADEVYKKDTNIIDLGELMEFETLPAIEHMHNEIEVGSPKQDYRHPSGRLEFNAPLTFSLPFTNVKNKLNLITKYRTDPYGMIFLMLDYRGDSTIDNSGDKSVFVVDITDELGEAFENAETFENITVNSAPLNPIIKFPLTGEIIHNNLPVLRGIAPPGANVNIYIADVLDGNTVADVDGNWEYQIVTPLPSYDPGVADGVAVINASFTTVLAPIDTIQLIIDTTVPGPTGITYPRIGDSLYNNLPLIKGVAPAGTNINILLDGVLLAPVVADNSGRWQYKVVVPISNGAHTLDIGTGLVTFEVDSFVAHPLITYIGSELDGFPIIDNTPLIRGVAMPGTQVDLYFDYVSYTTIGSAIADANGNWSFQTIPTTYPDPISGLPVTVVPFKNGVGVVSTSLVNQVVQIAVSGYKLNRPAYDSITGVLDNTVFNTRLSPKRMLLNHKSLLSSVMNMQRNDAIRFETADKNSNLRTVMGTEVIAERDDVQVSSLGAPMMLMEKAKIKTKAYRRFADILYEFNNGGTVKGTFKGTEIFFMPIGSMRMKSIMDDVQEWELMISSQTTYNKLLNLYKNGLTINLMENAIFHSDYNSLHFVTYNYIQPNKYNFKAIYDDWFTERNGAWSNPPQYVHKFQKDDFPLRDQIITNGVGGMMLDIYRCSDAKLMGSVAYNPVNPAPIPVPEVVMEAIPDLSGYDEGQYFFVQRAGETIVAISERIDLKEKWPRTICIESENSINMPGIFYSTGFQTVIRIEGLVKKLQPLVDTVIAKEESGDTSILYGSVAKKRMIRFGNAAGIPDYLEIKVACALTNDNCKIEGTYYVLQDGEKINPSEDIIGVPTYYYEVIMTLKENTRGKVFPGGEGSDVSGVIVVVDASAIGLPAHSLIDIEEY